MACSGLCFRRTSEPAAPKKTRTRRTFAERKAELQEQLAKLQAQAAKQELEEAIKSGECADPVQAKKLNSQLRSLGIGHRAYVDLGLVSEGDYQKAITIVSEALTEAVNGKE